MDGASMEEVGQLADPSEMNQLERLSAIREAIVEDYLLGVLLVLYYVGSGQELEGPSKSFVFPAFSGLALFATQERCTDHSWDL